MTEAKQSLITVFGGSERMLEELVDSMRLP